MERTQPQQELKDLQDDKSRYYKTSGKDFKSTGSWRREQDEEEEQSLEKWRTLVEPEFEELLDKGSEGTREQEELEGEEEVEKEVKGGDCYKNHI